MHLLFVPGRPTGDVVKVLTTNNRSVYTGISREPDLNYYFAFGFPNSQVWT